jgi:hypothetical protein
VIVDQRKDVRDFLVSRRARVSPTPQSYLVEQLPPHTGDVDHESELR